MIGATLLFTKKCKGTSFHVADRNIGGIISVFSIAATWIWAPSLFTSAEKAYVNGLPGLFWFLVPNVLCLIIYIPFAKKMRKVMPEGITLSGYMGNKYGSKVKHIYQFQLGSLTVLSTAVQLLAGSKILSTITGIPFWLLTIILAVIAFSYSQFSGIKASVITDVVQMIIILAGCALIAPWLLSESGGVTTLIQGLNGLTGDFGSLFDKNGLNVFLAFGLPTAIGLISGPFGDQSFWQRTFSIREKSIGKAYFFGALLFGLVPLSLGCVGYIAAGSGFIAADSSMVNFEFISNMLPSWVLIPFLFMILSGLLSTVDSNLCSVASLTTDREKEETSEENVKTSKIVMLALLAIAILIANIPGLTVTHLFMFYGTLRASTLFTTILSLKDKKLTPKGVFIGVLCSMIIGLPIFAYGSLANIAIYKTIGSLLTVTLSGTVALILSKREVKANA
ncbi:MAG: hypothetical protein IJE19_03225 [Clostridia bacterium]|nr:hypothetical protein [Clostridia bacterium]